jgi:RNA polymerase sigma-70 factor (ECF subfamily)
MPAKEPNVKAADCDDLSRFLEKHRESLRILIRGRLPSTLRGYLDENDILSDLFLRARTRWQSFQDQHARLAPEARPYDVWLTGLAKDCIIEAYRRETAQKRDRGREVPVPESSGSQLLIGLVSPGTSPSDAFDRAEMEERLNHVVALLPKSDQELLWQRYYEGWAWADVAAVLGLTETNANVRHVRAVRRLKDLWKQLYGPEGLQS